MDDDVSHAVNERLTALEEAVGINQEPDTDDKPGQGPHEDEGEEEVDAEEEAD